MDIGVEKFRRSINNFSAVFRRYFSRYFSIEKSSEKNPLSSTDHMRFATRNRARRCRSEHRFRPKSCTRTHRKVDNKNAHDRKINTLSSLRSEFPKRKNKQRYITSTVGNGSDFSRLTRS